MEYCRERNQGPDSIIHCSPYLEGIEMESGRRGDALTGMEALIGNYPMLVRARSEATVLGPRSSCELTRGYCSTT